MILQTHHVILKDKIVKKIDHNDVKEFESYINHTKVTSTYPRGVLPRDLADVVCGGVNCICR